MSRNKKYILIIYATPLALFLILNFIIYRTTIFSGFMGDDYIHCHYFLGTTLLERITGIFKSFIDVPASVKNVFGFYRPLFHAWITLNYTLFKTDPALWHLLHLIMQSANIFLFYLLLLRLPRLLRLSRISRFTFALFGSIFFSIFAGNYFTICWLAGAHDILAAFFFLLALNFYLNFRLHKNRKSFALSGLFYLCSLLIKEVAIGYIAIFFIFEAASFFHRNKNFRNIVSSIKNLSMFLLIIFTYIIVRRIILGPIVGYDVTYAGIYVKQNIPIVLSEIFLLDSIKTLGIPYTFYLLCSFILIVASIIIKFKEDALKHHAVLILVGFLWLIILLVPGIPFAFGLWRLYSPSLGLSIIFAALFAPAKSLCISQRKRTLLTLDLSKAIISLLPFVLFLIINSQLVAFRIDKYIADQMREIKVFETFPKQFPKMPDDAIIYMVNPYKNFDKIYGISAVSVAYNKKMNIQCFQYRVANSIKPSLLDKTYILEWNEKIKTFNIRDDIKGWGGDCFRNRDYNPYATWNFKGFMTPPPELRQTDYFEFSSENLIDEKGVLIEFRVDTFFDTEKNEIEVRLSAEPVSSDCEVNFYYAYSIVPVKMNSWHFIPLDIAPNGEFKTFSLTLKPDKRYKDVYWWGGSLCRMGLMFKGAFKDVKIDYVKTKL